MMGMDDMSAGGSSMGNSVEGALANGDGGKGTKLRRWLSGALNDEHGPSDEEEEDDERIAHGDPLLVR